jgi:acetoacetate decarboxylase
LITQYCQAEAYPHPPWPFRGADQIAFVLDTEASGWSALLPPGVDLDLTDDGDARAEIRVCSYPWSTFGPFLETYVIVRARHQDQVVWFLPLIMTDSDIPLSAGREAWGYAKKMALMSWQWNATTAGQVLFTMDRPAGQRLLTASFMPVRQADPAERHGHPVMSHRHITGSSGTISELIVLGGSKALQSDAAGMPVLWAGQGSIDVSAASPSDPWQLAGPKRILGAYWQRSDFALTPGRVVDDLTPAR